MSKKFELEGNSWAEVGGLSSGVASPDVWGADPDRTTRKEAWGQVESSALGVANYRQISGGPRHTVRRGLNWFSIIATILLIAALVGIVACFVWAANLSGPAPVPVESAAWVPVGQGAEVAHG